MKNKIAVIALLMVSVTIGTLFPKIVLTYQDKNLQNKTFTYDIDQKDFKTENKILNTLDAYTSGNFYKAKDSIKDTKLSRDEVLKSIKKFYSILNKYAEYQVDYEKIINYKESASLYLSESIISSMSTVADDESLAKKYKIWTCSFETESGFKIELKLDDESGKVISFYMYKQKLRVSLFDFEKVNKMKKFFEEYYEVSAQIETVDKQNFDITLYDKDSKEKAKGNTEVSPPVKPEGYDEKSKRHADVTTRDKNEKSGGGPIAPNGAWHMPRTGDSPKGLKSGLQDYQPEEWVQ